MDEQSVRNAALAHVHAIVEHDLDGALLHVVPTGRQEIGQNLQAVSALVCAASVEGVQLSSGREEAIAYLRFVTSDPADKEVLIESHWVEGSDRGPLLAYAHRV